MVAECYPDFEGLVEFSNHSYLSLLLLTESFDAGDAHRDAVKDIDNGPWLVGLILTQSLANCESEFIRIGVFRIREKGSMFGESKPQRIILA